MANVITNELQKQMLTLAVDDELTGAGPLDGAKVALYTGTPTLSRAMVYSDFTQPTFTGYAIKDAVWDDAAFLDNSGAYTVACDALQFQASGGTPNDVVRGYVVFTGANPNQKVLWAEELDEPVSISEVGDGLVVIPALKLGNDGDYGSGTVIA